MVGKDFTECVKGRYVHRPDRRVRSCPLHSTFAPRSVGNPKFIDVAESKDRVPLHLSMRSGSAGLRHLSPADGMSLLVKRWMKDTGVCFKAFRYLTRHRTELSLKSGSDPGSSYGTVGKLEVVLNHVPIVVKEGGERDCSPSTRQTICQVEARNPNPFPAVLLETCATQPCTPRVSSASVCIERSAIDRWC